MTATTSHSSRDRLLSSHSQFDYSIILDFSRSLWSWLFVGRLSYEAYRRGRGEAAGLERLFYGSDPMVMEEPVSVVPGGVREREEGLRAAFDAAAASGITPERAREDLRLSRSSGIPFYMINESERVRNSALLEEHRRACRESFARAAREAPVTSRFLSDPGRMLTAGGNVGRMTEAEGLIATALRAHRAGAAQAELSQLLGRVAAYNDESAETAARIEELRREVEEIGNAPDSGFANWLWSAVNQLPQWERQWASGGGYGAAAGGRFGRGYGFEGGGFYPVSRGGCDCARGYGLGRLARVCCGRS